MKNLKNDNKYWKDKLTPEEYAILREKGTEPPFSGEFVDNKESGVYTCRACKLELFSSDKKYDSGSGWPSFSDVLDSGKVELVHDSSHGMQRTEAVCANCKSHLGHVFNDGPTETGKRFCINSLSLGFDSGQHGENK